MTKKMTKATSKAPTLNARVTLLQVACCCCFLRVLIMYCILCTGNAAAFSYVRNYSDPHCALYL